MPPGNDDYSRITLPPEAGTPFTLQHPSTDWNVADNLPAYATGDLQRMYDYQFIGKVFTMMTMKRDPFLHLMNTLKGQRLPTTDTPWKYPVERNVSSVKRYGYIVGIDANATIAQDYDESNSTYVWATFLGKNSAKFKVATTNCLDTINVDDEFSLLIAGDFTTSGNVSNIIGRTSSDSNFIALGDEGTKPKWFLPNKLVKIPLASSIGGTTVVDYALAKVQSVYNWYFRDSDDNSIFKEGVVLNCRMLKIPFTAANKYPTGCVDAGSLLDVSHSTGSGSIAEKLEPLRTYIYSNAHHELSGYPSNWMPQPYQNKVGFNQIFKEAALLSGRSRAAKMKWGINPAQKAYQQALGDFNWDLGTTSYFGEQLEDADGFTYAEGLITFGILNGNALTLDRDNDTIDTFIDNYSAINDPRYMFEIPGGRKIIHFCDTPTWNWLHKMGGFVRNTMQLSPNYKLNVDFAWAGRGKINGVNFSRFSVMGEDMDLVKDPHLDGTHIKMVSTDIKSCFIRPFIGWENRDVAVYKEVASLKKNGQDFTVDLIQGDIGFMFTDPQRVTIYS